MNLAYNGPSSDISGRSVARFFICGLVLCGLSDVPNTWNIAYDVACGVTGVLLIAVLLMPFRQAITLLLLLALAGKDIVYSAEIGDQFATASIWQLRFGPVRPSWIIFACILWQFLKIRNPVIPSFAKPAIIWFVTVPIATGLIYGGFSGAHASTEVVKDVKFGMMLITSTLLFVSFLQMDARNLPRVLSAFIGILLARHLVDLACFLANLGPSITEGVSRASLDSAKGGIVFLVFFGTILIWGHRRHFLGIAIAIPSVVLLASYGTRMLWVTSLLGAIITLMFLGLRRSVLYSSIAAVLVVGGGWALSIAHPDSARVILARSRTITQGRDVSRFAVPVDDNLISRIDPIRYGEVLNIFDSAGRRCAYLWGTGYGGYYEDSAVVFPLTLIGSSSFPDYSLYSGRFYKAHTFSAQIFLKHGLVGLLCICSLWFVPGYSLFQVFRSRDSLAKGEPKMLYSVMLCIAAFLPTGMLQTAWSGKGLFINGLVIVLCAEFARQYHNNSAKQKGHQVPGDWVPDSPTA